MIRPTMSHAVDKQHLLELLSVYAANLERKIAELEKQIEFKIKECQELASSCNRWKLEALKEKGE